MEILEFVINESGIRLDKFLADNSSLSRSAATGLIEDGKVAEFEVEKEEFGCIIGNVYKGRVMNVLTGMNAAFIDCNFTQADFIESDFNGTRFDNCDFSCISMEKSCIKGTEFFGTEPEPEQQLRCYILGPDPEQNQNINL